MGKNAIAVHRARALTYDMGTSSRRNLRCRWSRCASDNRAYLALWSRLRSNHLCRHTAVDQALGHSCEGRAIQRRTGRLRGFSRCRVDRCKLIETPLNLSDRLCGAGKRNFGATSDRFYLEPVTIAQLRECQRILQATGRIPTLIDEG
jgi:hypothetical protein